MKLGRSTNPAPRSRRGILFVVATSLLVLSGVGALEALLLPREITWQSCFSRWEVVTGVRSTTRGFQLMWMLQIRRIPGPSAPNASSSQFKIVRKYRAFKLALWPKMDCSWSKTNKFFLEVQIPYVDMLLVGLTVEWLRRRLAMNRGRGFPIEPFTGGAEKGT